MNKTLVARKSGQLPLQLNAPVSSDVSAGLRAIEAEDFPFEAVSAVAERESWRKEINRPIYHVHKWWAQRLGSVFRSIVIGALAPAGTDVLSRFYDTTRFPEAIVYDPFMGSGTTLGEALKLGCRAIGRDINPVAYFLVRNALEAHSRTRIEEAFAAVGRALASDLEQYYKCLLPSGESATALYYFWVKVLPCPSCDYEVDLFSSQIFAKHAYPQRHPDSQALCPACGELNVVRFDEVETTCGKCSAVFNPQKGNVHGRSATCPSCKSNFPVAETARRRGKPPGHRLYAKLVLTKENRKLYLKADDFDRKLYREAQTRLQSLSELYPIAEIKPGYNTNQALNYGYQYWHQMFNDRQLLCLGLLARAISQIEETEVRDALTCLFSGTLEFNNMFTSYKGEGTGAVRHMFYHHILKPEKTPLEANVWGTSKSSGSFSGMFTTRLKRALDYSANPFEITSEGDKVFGLSSPIGADRADTFKAFSKGAALYLSCGDSSQTDLDSGSVDAVITDPPFFDNVNYSQLADFFHVWQRHVLNSDYLPTTRSDREVQHQDAEIFSDRLRAVLDECHRVLKDSGVLVFSYHHSRSEGWTSVLSALSASNFVVTAAHPIKAEMSGATPKNQAKEPIDLDIILVCRKGSAADRTASTQDEAVQTATRQIARLRASGRKLSRNDVRVVLMGQLLRAASQGAEDVFDPAFVDTAITRLYSH